MQGHFASRTKLFLSSYTVDGQGQSNFSYTPGGPAEWDGIQLSLWAVEIHGCKPRLEDAPDLTEKIVLIQRGNCSPEDVAAELLRAGARYFTIASDGEDVSAVYFDNLESARAVATVSFNIGSKWNKHLEDGSNVQLDDRT